MIKRYQMNTKCTKWLQIIPFGSKIYKMAIKIPTSSIARPSKIYPNGDFGLKIYHLATLIG
jgi:hypothetical protein